MLLLNSNINIKEGSLNPSHGSSIMRILFLRKGIVINEENGERLVET
jgi:hypothetical protein